MLFFSIELEKHNFCWSQKKKQEPIPVVLYTNEISLSSQSDVTPQLLSQHYPTGSNFTPDSPRFHEFHGAEFVLCKITGFVEGFPQIGGELVLKEKKRHVKVPHVRKTSKLSVYVNLYPIQNCF